MKKIISLLLAFSLLTGVSMTAIAEAASDGSGSYNGSTASPGTTPINGTYAPAASGEIYYVDVEWSGMSFTYHAGSKGEWSPDLLRYTGASDAYWTSSDTDTGCGKITLTNKSAPDGEQIDAILSYKQDGGFTAGSVSMKFATDAETVKKGEGTARSFTVADLTYNEATEVYVFPAESKNQDGSKKPLEPFGSDVKMGDITITIEVVNFDPPGPEGPEIFD